jgi:uncharacterized protein YtpQ (UPF0354 family)
MAIDGIRPPHVTRPLPSESPEHDWTVALGRAFPALRPGGTHGARLDELDETRLVHEGLKKHALPIIDPGPAELSIVYVLREPAYDVVINAEHLLTWGISGQTLRDAAMDNLRAWSATAPWTEELAGQRRLLSSDTGGGDAARILLPEVRRHLAGQCGGPSRVLIGLPDRDLLIAGSLHPDDADFAEQLATFVADVVHDAHEPIESRLFELVGEDFELVPFGP